MNIGTAGIRTLFIGSATATLTMTSAGTTIDATTLSIDSTDTTNFTMTANNAGTKTMTISATNAGVGVSDIAISADGGLTLDSVNALDINSSAGEINIGNDAINQNINIGTAGTRVIQVGNSDAGGTGTTNIYSGSGGIAINTYNDGAIDIDGEGVVSINSGEGAINIGNDAINQNINLGTAGTRTLNIGSATATLAMTSAGTTIDATTLSIDSTDTTNLTMTANNAGDKTMTITATNAGVGVSHIAISADGGLTLDSVNALDINSSAGEINIGNDAINQNINIGTAGIRTLNIGSATATLSMTSAGTTIDATTLSIDSTDTTNFTMTANDAGTKTMTISATNAGVGVSDIAISADGGLTLDSVNALDINSSAGEINIGNDAINQNINIGTAGTRTLNIGSVLSTLNIESLDTTIKLGDAAGVRKIYITDSADAEVGSIDSNGKATMTQLTGSGTATEPIISNDPSSLAGSFRSMSLSVLNNRRIAMGLTNACADSGTSTAGADFSIWAYDDNGNFTAQLFQIDRSSRDVSILGTSSSTSSSTGALIVAGGIGITNTTDASSSTNGGTITTAGGLAVAKKAYFGSTTSSTSSSTGALIVTGGIGITNTTDASSSTNGGTITTAGGLAVAKKAYFESTTS